MLHVFTRVLHDHDPLNLNGPSDEYQREALSLLCRFVEADIDVLTEDEALMKASDAVIEVFDFWFDGHTCNDLVNDVAFDLIRECKRK